MLKRELAVLLLASSSLILAGCGNSGTKPAENTASQKPAAASDGSEVRVASAEAAAETDAEATPAADRVASREPDAGATPSAPADEAPAKLPAVTAIPLDEAPDADLAMPKVSLSDAHSALCKVKVGDAFPDLQLNDVDGQAQSTSKLLGERLTVIAFWNGGKTTSLEELADLSREIAARFTPRGVKIVAINSGDEPQLAAELAKKAEAGFPVLIDAGGNALAQLAAERVPSTYLLDASGRVVWFDIEYSRTTRRDLAHAIRFLLAQK